MSASLIPQKRTLTCRVNKSGCAGDTEGNWAFACLVVGHAAAALFHHFVLRDDVLESMAPAIAKARTKQELVTGHIVSETL